MNTSKLRTGGLTLAATALAATGALAPTALAPTAPAHAADGQSITVYATDVNVRSDATSQSTSVGKVSQRTAVFTCQKAGETVSSDGYTNNLWSRSDELGGYVNNVFLQGPADFGLPACDGDSEPTQPPAPGGEDVTLDQLKTLFPNDIHDEATLAEDLANLNAEMKAAGITTPARKAAFLATLASESGLAYDREEGDQSHNQPYWGRGYIQLTTADNYADASNALGVDLSSNPELAMSRDHSARIATWYWTDRDLNAAADALDMAAVNKGIGYRANDAEDTKRCNNFTAALTLFNGGSLPGEVNCAR
ncbi:putative chitinase [Naumannella cuiyingiana]|uniref:Putative chitinase n=1 Tax=Naumannella cuiyingiana TaxID=1347891 RepID=A0A7Z0D662_9ACTN|nr:glycoside hydrolase family 19 protein [Naumannella cuiyingiana]NYI69593.1 putative chitinase [Naumannella cuiyingiana]